MDRNAGSHRRWVALVLLVAVLSAFGLAVPVPAETAGVAERPGHGVGVLAVAAPPSTGLANPPGAPELPLADAEPPAPSDEPLLVAGADGIGADSARPRAHRHPAADRAPPA